MTWGNLFHLKKLKLLCKSTRNILQLLLRIHQIKLQERLWITLKAGRLRVQWIRWKQNILRTPRNQIKIINQISFLWASEILSLTSYQQMHRLKIQKINKKVVHLDNQLMSPLDKLTNCLQEKTRKSKMKHFQIFFKRNKIQCNFLKKSS